MTTSKVASRYAKALLDLSMEMNLLEKVNADILMISNLGHNSRELIAFFRSPIIQRRKKYQVIHTLFSGRIDDITLKFIGLITKNGRDNILPEILESFTEYYKKHKGILDVYIRSAVRLETNVKESILAKVKKDFKGDIVLHEAVDESLIGGFVVSIEDKRMDASIKSQLLNLKNILLN